MVQHSKTKREWLLARHIEANKLGWTLYNSCDCPLFPYYKAISKRLIRATRS